MLHHILTTVIRDTFLEKVEKHNPGVALLLSFNKNIDTEKEDDGYRWVDLVITAPDNYVQIWVRERWNILPLNTIKYTDDGERYITQNYIKGESEWQLLCNHDSCWTDSISKFIWNNRNNLITFSAPRGYFYTISDVPEGCTKKRKAFNTK